MTSAKDAVEILPQLGADDRLSEVDRSPAHELRRDYLAVVHGELDAREIHRRGLDYAIDPNREPVLRVLFDLAREGVPNGLVARRLNADGHRTRYGRPFTRRNGVGRKATT